MQLNPNELDEILIKGCLRGDNNSQKKLYEKYSRKMFALCLRYSESRDHAGDLLQEGFIRVFQNLAKFKSSGSFEGWIRKIMVNTAIEHFRKQARNPETVDIELAENESFNDSMLEKFNMEDLMLKISSLPAGYRTVFNLYIIEGYSHKEIGEMLGIGESTSKTQLYKARLMLQKSLTERKEASHGAK